MPPSNLQRDASLDRFFRHYAVLVTSALIVGLVVFAVFARHLEHRLDDIERSVQRELQYQPPDDALAEEAAPASMPSGRHITYVPAHSHVYRGEGEPVLLTITLAIRNTDPSRDIYLHGARYHDTSGKLLRNLVSRPLRVGPLATIEYLIGESDVSGGSGANFVVEWSADPDVNEPLIEALMIGASSRQGISFVQQGRGIPSPMSAPADATRREP